MRAQKVVESWSEAWTREGKWRTREENEGAGGRAGCTKDRDGRDGGAASHKDGRDHEGC